MPPAETSRHPRTHPVRFTAFDLGSRPPATAHVAEYPLRAYPMPLGDVGLPTTFRPLRPPTFASCSGVCATSAYQCLPLPVAGAPSALRLLASRAGPAVILQRRASRQLPDTRSARRRQLRPRPPRRCGLRPSPASALRHPVLSIPLSAPLPEPPTVYFACPPSAPSAPSAPAQPTRSVGLQPHASLQCPDTCSARRLWRPRLTHGPPPRCARRRRRSRPRRWALASHHHRCR